jgi:hypothetical protein
MELLQSEKTCKNPSDEITNKHSLPVKLMQATVIIQTL